MLPRSIKTARAAHSVRASTPRPDAELAGLTVLHLDKDFDLIAGITGQPVERLNVHPTAVVGNDTDQTEE